MARSATADVVSGLEVGVVGILVWLLFGWIGWPEMGCLTELLVVGEGLLVMLKIGFAQFTVVVVVGIAFDC